MTSTTNTTTVSKPAGGTVHVGRRSRFSGMVVTACNGRTMAGVTGAGEVTCRSCKGGMESGRIVMATAEES